MVLALPTPPTAPTLVCILHPSPMCIPHPPSMCIPHPSSPMCIPHPKAQGQYGAAPALPQAPGTKGLEESANFSPQLELIFSSDAPTAGGGMAAEKQVRQGKAGWWQRAAARPCAAAGLIRC